MSAALPRLFPKLRTTTSHITFYTRTAPKRFVTGTMSKDTTSGHSRPIYFWRETEVATGYLSQWFALPFTDPEDTSGGQNIYPTAEHYMMYHKAQLFEDVDVAAAVLETDHPRDVKGLGRAVRGYTDSAWYPAREKIVQRGNYCKFTYAMPSSSPPSEGTEAGTAVVDWRLGHGKDAHVVSAQSFRDVLLATGDALLVEASPYDRIWGIGFKAQDAERNQGKWGENLLGKALMAVRDEFRKEGEADKK